MNRVVLDRVKEITRVHAPPRSCPCGRPGTLPCLASWAAAIALLTGCGGPSPEQRFAEKVCGATVAWAEKIQETYDEVRLTRAAPGNDAFVILSGLVLRGLSDAKSYGAELGALAAPNTDAGRQAKEWLDNSARRVIEVMRELNREVRRLPENITLIQSIRGLQRLETDLVRVLFAMQSIPDSIAEVVPELEEQFEEASSCKELETLESD